MREQERVPAGSIERGADGLRLRGAWTTRHLDGIVTAAKRLERTQTGETAVRCDDIAALDTAGAWLLARIVDQLEGDGCQVHVTGLREHYAALLALVRQRRLEPPAAAAPAGVLGTVGREAAVRARTAVELLGFLGETVLGVLAAVRRPSRLRPREAAAIIERAGVGAIPIVALLSFLLGIVIAYQGGVQLRDYGAGIFIVELVCLTMLREIAPMMTAVIVAGRTGSAFAAEIGTMKVTEEIDALRTIGLAPMDLLVLPRVFALLVALPLLTMLADVAGVAGGMTMAAVLLDVDAAEFARRIPEAVSLTSFWIGIGKAPVFALLIAVVGCFQGFAVRGGAQAVGRHTTLSVVQSIFLVIVADAVFSVLFSWFGI
ncbi:MAG: ABC transporter permease [Gammaproteobacteria bacterium]|nr:ABC transporter permease [Gammaproteobacteria bacterium]